ncbi:MAG: flagellar motor switch protein FliN [Parahaliea sp.]
MTQDAEQLLDEVEQDESSLSDSEREDQGSVAGVPEFDSQAPAPRGPGEVNLSMLLDVPVTLSVEIGRARIPVSKLLSLSQGSVVELDREISAPLDLMVNGMLIARGEVVETQGKFGLRLVDVVSTSERIKKLK